MKSRKTSSYFFVAVVAAAAFFTINVVCEEEYCDAADASCNMDQIQEKLRNKLVVAAIDFGTTYSGWAYQAKHDYKKDPLNIRTSKWEHNDILSRKTPTTVLIHPDGKTLVAFGYQAETTYLALAAEEEHYNYYYFKRFKMMLYDKKKLNRDTMLTDDKGLQLPAITVFSLAIDFLKDNLMADLKRKDESWDIEDIHWVLTVPAIWNDTAKQFMRKSAVEAGIKNEDLTIALEPEAASLYCRLLPVEKQTDSQGLTFVNSFQPGRKYMVLDAGGGTVDITVHQVLQARRVKELYKASGGPWGGTKVDSSFQLMLIKLVGDTVYEQFKQECSYDYLDIFRSFENIKRSIIPNSDRKLAIRFPMCLGMVLKRITGSDISDRISVTYKSSIRQTMDRLLLDADLGRSFFKEAIDNIVAWLKYLFENGAIRDLDTILLVGGFAESRMLEGAIISNFGHIAKVLTPKDAELAILKGAVIFGYNPSVVEERISKFTYGVAMLQDFIDDVHDQTEKVEIDGKFKCRNLFNRFVTMGETIKYNTIQGEDIYEPVSASNRNMHLPIYACTSEKPLYVKDKTCTHIGSMTIDILDRSVPVQERKFLVEFIFSDTEIKVSVTEQRTGNKKELYLDFD